MSDDHKPGYIVEFVVLGGHVKVTAIDPITMRESVTIGAPGMPRKELARLAIRKLEYLINRDKPE